MQESRRLAKHYNYNCYRINTGHNILFWSSKYNEGNEGRMTMRKGNATNIIVSIVCVVLALVIIYLLVVPLIVNIGKGDKERCKVGVLSTAHNLKKNFAILCTPDYVLISSSYQAEKVYEAFATQIARAWYISGKGESKPFEHSKEKNNICLITAKIHFENKDHKCNDAGCIGLFDYIKGHDYESIEGKFSYVDYLNFSTEKELSVKINNVQLSKKTIGFQNFYYHDDKEKGVLEKITTTTKIDPSVIDYYVIILRDKDFEFERGYSHSVIVLPVKYMGEVCNHVLN